ncbi:MAG TPA: hypothetical protein VM283_01355, partial [Armatimonadota bacterium]|nr:hypothetical protein [Armatimonadota bacterium]
MAVRELTMVLICVCVLAAPALAQGYPTEGQLLTNPGFDTDANDDGIPDGWNTDAARAQLREKQFMGGDRELVSVGDAYVLATQDITLEPGEEYTVSFSARGSGGGLAGALIVHGQDQPVREMPLLWRAEVEEDYLTYLVSFTAPNPVARLYIYNCAKKGQVAYDWVSLVKGKSDQAYIRQFRFGDRDMPITEPVVREHTPWATPLAGGPIRAFVSLYRYQTVRELVELAQRFELDYDVVEGGYTGDSMCSPNGHQMMRELAAGNYEVYVIASRMSEGVDKAVKRNVEAGAGLVVISGFGRITPYCNKDDLQVVGRGDPLLRDIPFDLMPQILAEVRTGMLGQGRVVWLNFPTDISRVWGVWPVENSHAAYMTREMRYWEYWHALIARTIQYAARGESPVENNLATGADHPAITVTGAPPGATCDITLRSTRELRWGEPDLTFPTQTAPVGGGTVPIAVPPNLPDGDALMDVTVRDADGGALWWGSPLRISSEQEATIAEIVQPQESWEPGDAVSATVNIEGAPEGASLQARLVDAYGRVIAQSSQDAAAQVQVSLTPPADQVLCVGHKLFLKLMRGPEEVDSAWTDVYFPRRANQDPAD